MIITKKKCISTPVGERQIASICKKLDARHKRIIAGRPGLLAPFTKTEQEELKALRWIKRMVCAEGPMNFINHFCGVKLSREANREISDILKE